METIIAEGFNQLNKFIGENKLNWVYFVVIIINIFSFIIGWLFATFKVKSEIEKLKVEKEKLEIEGTKITADTIMSVFDKKKSLAEAYIDKNKFFQQKIEDYKSFKLRNCQKEATAIWQELKLIYFNDIFTSFKNYLDFFKDFYVKDQSKLNQFADEEVLPFISLSAKFFQKMNSQENLTFTNQQAFSVEKFITNGLFSFVNQHLSKDLSPKLEECKKIIDNYLV